MPRVLAPAEIARLAQLAALLEVATSKPGNVGPEHDFADTGFEDFLHAALLIGPPLGGAGQAGVGETVLRAVEATRRRVPANVNLGIVLLFAPLARAAASGSGALRPRVEAVLAGLTLADAESAYRAIRMARPGGLGTVPEQDVQAPPSVTLRQAMALAAERDAVAREYATGFAITFEVGLPALIRAEQEAGARAPATGAGITRAAVLETFLTILARVPDTLIARRCGPERAAQISRQAAAMLGATAPGGIRRRDELARLDAELRRSGNALNPGTTADLTAAAVFAQLLEQGLGAPE